MSKTLDLIQYGAVIASLTLLLFISWKIALLVFGINFVVGLARYNWRNKE